MIWWKCFDHFLAQSINCYFRRLLYFSFTLFRLFLIKCQMSHFKNGRIGWFFSSIFPPFFHLDKSNTRRYRYHFNFFFTFFYNNLPTIYTMFSTMVLNNFVSTLPMKNCNNFSTTLCSFLNKKNTQRRVFIGNSLISVWICWPALSSLKRFAEGIVFVWNEKKTSLFFHVEFHV